MYLPFISVVLSLFKCLGTQFHILDVEIHIVVLISIVILDPFDQRRKVACFIAVIG